MTKKSENKVKYFRILPEAEDVLQQWLKQAKKVYPTLNQADLINRAIIETGMKELKEQ